MPGFGLTNPLHIAILLGLALLLFGGRRLPEIGRSLGTGMREFKDAITGNNPDPQSELPPAEPNIATLPPSEHDTTP